MWNLRTEQFNELLNRIEFVLKRLIDSFAVGNVIKNGFRLPLWRTQCGKSTLLNALLNEERAIVSEIAGTTRDTIEDELVIGGIGFDLTRQEFVKLRMWSKASVSVRRLRNRTVAGGSLSI
jgi:tRNA U34 5-carboxymethylaminomethyl modifying GTPase MnmE/TrmE